MGPDPPPRLDSDQDLGTSSLLLGVRRMLVIREFAKHWWIIVLQGVAAVVFGVLLIAHPGVGLATLVLIVAVWALADGILALFASITALRWPVTSALVLYLLIACWLTVRGIVQIAASIALRRELEGEVWMFLGGIGSIAFSGRLVITPPAAGALAVGYAMGLYALIVGFTFIWRGFSCAVSAFRCRALPRLPPGSSGPTVTPRNGSRPSGGPSSAWRTSWVGSSRSAPV
jgi:uncharacterized membrane protein HdeD (DUF308 family)